MLATNSIRFPQNTTQDSIQPSIETLWKTSNALNNTKQFDKLLVYLEKYIHDVHPKNEKDSLDVSDLYFNQFQGHFYTGNYLESIKSANKGLLFCQHNKSKRGILNTGALYYKRAYGESEMNFAKRAKLSMKTAIEYLPETNERSLDYLVDAHVFLASQAAYHGNTVDAKRYFRLANNIYKNHKTYLDKARNDRYEVVLAYREAYIFYKFSKTQEDSLQIVKIVKKLDELHASPKFNKHEQIYYTTALNHIGDWYLGRKHDSLIDADDLEKSTFYLDKSINLVQEKNYSGDLITFKYNKCKALTYANKLIEAEALIVQLLDEMSPNDYRKPFFLAQKALIKAKTKQKDSALRIFHEAIAHIHADTTILAKDYSNFKPSKVYGEARLIRRVAEKLEKFYSDDISVQKMIPKLYEIAFIQFENSYARTKFNPNQNDVLRKILHGFLVAKTAYPQTETITIDNVLSRTETIMNQMTWQRFYQNRFTNSLPKLDSLKYRNLNLRTQLTAAKKEQNIRSVDSIQELIQNHELYTGKQFPNLALLSDKEFNIDSLQKHIHDDEIVIKYLLFEDEIAIFSITSDAIRWELRPWTATEIALEEELINSIRNRTYNREIAVQLSQKLLPNIDKTYRKIIINPDGELYRIPFEVLQHNEHYLIEKYQIQYTSNLGFIHFENQLQPTKKGVLAIYAPTYPKSETALATRNSNNSSFLQGAAKEAEIISKLFPSKTYVGTAISKNYFLETAPKAGILHLAMHAEINTEEPGLSRLLFNKNSNTDDDLCLEELYALQLKADLAVLSACNTGLGKESAGRNLESFQRAFTFSGVPATVVSLWEVPDQSTSEIMEHFYSNLKVGNTKSEALKNAKIHYLNKHKGTKLAQPYYWTGFVLYGDKSAVSIAQTSNSSWYIAIAIMLFISLFAFVKFRRKND
ncbi:CHAT domain-containing protein [Kordia periserrulae]|uniref:CHAT domain-containing protein n=1 Tax=Kordia periserrulae TaxID=701523 RepID=A0A2T6C575_9FLAO|nr:CHAT domain-containing protein [Kordia periserrulae]PTX63488.1 CHAT domain-containing protein [Kordia periserrulae]